jgi:hypothetical protein
MNTLQSSTCLLLCTTVLSGCDPPLPKKSNAQSGATPVEQAADWPEGTVIVVGNEPILASEIENWADTIALVEPSHTRPDHLRKALTNLVLHKKVARQILPEECERARKKAVRALENLRSGSGISKEGPQVVRVTGTWNDIEQDIGLDRWGASRGQNASNWQLLETLGGWSVMRAPMIPAEWLPNSDVTIEHVTFYYLEPATMKREIQAALEKLPIRVLDRQWREILPVYYDHLVTNESP